MRGWRDFNLLTVWPRNRLSSDKVPPSLGALQVLGGAAPGLRPPPGVFLEQRRQVRRILVAHPAALGGTDGEAVSLVGGYLPVCENWRVEQRCRGFIGAARRP